MNNAIKNTLKEFYEQEEENSEKIINQLLLYIYSLDSKEHDAHIVGKFIPDDYLKLLIEYFDGATIKLPSKEKYQESLLLTLCFYLKVVKEWNWTEIKEFMDLPDKYKEEISMISVGGKINKIKDKLNKEISNLITTVPMSEFHSFFKEHVNIDNEEEKEKFLKELEEVQSDE